MGVVSVARIDVKSGRYWVPSAAIIFLIAFVALPWLGPGPLDLDRVVNRQPPDYGILVQLRLSRTLLGLFAGGALALSGCLFQAMLRDALATPYTLGVSSGSALGAVMVIFFGWQSAFGIPAIWLGSYAGAAVVLFVVVGGALRERRLSAFRLLLTGIAVNSVCSALIILLHSLASMAHSFSISRWLIGSVDSSSYTPLAIFIAAVSIAAVWVVRQAKSWNLVAVGEQWAATRGVRVPNLMLTGYLAGSLLTAATIAFTGPIGFVGLIVPHIIRSRIGADHRVLMPSSFFIGGALLALCDAIGRVVIAPAEIPAGAIMAVAGGPYLVWLVRQRL